jgi:hypothetical protein
LAASQTADTGWFGKDLSLPETTLTMERSKPLLFTAFAILAILVVLYSLTYSGTFLVDDEHILASRAISLASDEQINDLRVMGNGRVFALSQLPPAATNIEPAQTLISVPLVKLACWLGFGQVQILLLLNIWVTALTAMMLFFIISVSGYSKRTAFIASMLFGLCTIVFPYTQTYFRDPLAMLFLTCAWFFRQKILLHDKTLPNQHGVFLWVGLFASLTVGILAKNTVLLAVPVVIIELLLESIKRKGFSSWVKEVISSWKRQVGWLAGITGLILVWIFLIPEIPILSRFSPVYYRYLAQYFFTTPHPHFLEAISGPFISQGKSLFLFSPILCLSLWSLIKRFRQVWSTWLYLILLVIAQAFFYDDGWAGLNNWGLRYVMLAIPLLFLTIVPIIDRWLMSRTGMRILAVSGLVSFCIQLLGALTPIGKYYATVYSSPSTITEYSSIWNLKDSIIGWSIRWILSFQPVDIAIVRMVEPQVGILLISMLILIAAFFSVRYRSLKYLSMLAVVSCIGLHGVMMTRFSSDLVYGKNRTDLFESQQFIMTGYQVEDGVLVKSYASATWYYWMNWTSPELEWVSLPFSFPVPVLIEKFKNTGNPEDALDGVSLAILNREALSSKRIWLVLPSDSPGTSLELEKTWLSQRFDERDCSLFISEGKTTEVCLFLRE